MKTALIIGITGQDGLYLTDLLLSKGYIVHGMVRSSTTLDIKHERLHLHRGDLTDSGCMLNIIKKTSPEEIYNLGSQSHVGISFDIPEYTTDVDGVGTLRILEAIRSVNPKIKYFQANSSEIYGNTEDEPHTETSPLNPRSPYGCAKAYAYWLVRSYREAYGMFACTGVLFNHESPRRDESYIVQRVVKSIGRISRGEQKVLYLGNLDSRRDWGHAQDYVDGMWRILQEDKPEDYILSTGVTHSVRDLVEKVCRQYEIDIEWFGNGRDEIGMDVKTKKTIVSVNRDHIRPNDVRCLCGDSTKAYTKLGWKPTHNFNSLVKDLCDYEKVLSNTEK